MADQLRVLLIEDAEDDAVLLVRELERAGYDVLSHRAWTPASVDAALDETWDIAISDWSMPSFTGLDAFEIVRRRDAHLPFIIVSGTIGEDVAVDALTAGVDDFMSKGKLARLAPAIERARRAAKARREQAVLVETLERKRQEIERSERLLRVVLDAVPDGVIVANERGELIATNPAAAALFGPDLANVGLAGILESSEVLTGDRATHVPPAQRPLPTALRGEPVERQELYVVPRGRVDGRYLSISAYPLVEQLGTISAVAVLRDITHERTAQEQLLISDRLASVGMLAAGVAHEINNPLAAVIANLELIESDLGSAQGATHSTDDLREMLKDARTAAARVHLIVRDLKLFSRTEESEPTAVDVRRALESVLRMAWNDIRHRATLVKELEEVPLVRGSESRLGQVLINIIINAVQAIPEGNADANTIRIATRQSGEMVAVEIADSGAGMSAATKQRLFTPFFTTKPQGEGTGLGLVIAHRIVTQLGGQIQVESELGRGTTFRIMLPVAPSATAQATRARATQPLSRRARILVVDDEQIVTNAIRRVLGTEHDVQTTNFAKDALETMRAGAHFDVILCDLMMPQMSGMELYAELEKLGVADRVVFVTGGAFTSGARQFLDRVTNQRLDKPFDAKTLRELVAERVRMLTTAPSPP